MKKMRMALMFVALAAISADSWAAMSLSDIRREARFLTDRMGHELGLSNRQYEDVYEINFDFFYHVNEVIDDVVYGYDDAVDYYYYLLDVRNEDLLYVLRNRQYRKFVNRDYFYRPIYMIGNDWSLRIYSRYDDRNYFYFSAPIGYHSYRGAHYRIHFSHSYYASLYSHALFHGAFRLWGVGYDHRHHDGWKSIGKHKPAGSHNWSNMTNYRQSRRELKKGYVSVPSREEDKRMVSIDSEENNRTVVVSNVSSRNGSSFSRNSSASSASRSSSSSSRNSSASSASRSSSSSSRNSSDSSASHSSSSSSRNSSDSSASRSSSSSSKSSSASSASRSSSSSSKSSSVSSGSRSGSSSSRSGSR